MTLLFAALTFGLFLFVKAGCPDGSIASLSDSTKCYRFEPAKMNFMAADQFCVGRGGNLVSIHSMFDNVFISGEASSFFTDSTSGDFWIGANSLYKPGTWTWMDGTPFDFNDWDKGQPQNISNCGASKIQGGQWIADDCFKNKSFVCMNTISVTTTILPPTTTKPKTCEIEWTEFDGFCYKVFDPRNWYEAEQMCVIEKAHLASIHNTLEALFVANLAYYNGSDACDGKTQAWIGLFADDNFKNYKWTDDTPFDYRKWGKQSDPVPPYYCNVLSLAPVCGDITGVFYANPCDTFNAKFVCKKQPS